MRCDDEPSWIPEPEHDLTIESNWLFTLRRERFRSRRSERTHDYYVMHLADAVNVVAVTTGGELLLVRQFRAGSRSDSLETPGGLVDAGEDPAVAGARELLEETGYAGDTVETLGSMWANSSILTSRAWIVLITGARKVAEPRWDAGEELVMERVAVSDVGALVREGGIDHALSVAAVLWWLAGRSGGPFAPSGS